jgi:hypothetical protein
MRCYTVAWYYSRMSARLAGRDSVVRSYILQALGNAWVCLGNMRASLHT